MTPHGPCPRHGYPVCSGLFHLEDARWALRGLHALLGNGGSLDARDVQGLWFLLRTLLEDLDHSWERLREEAAADATDDA